jgi:hypothetical protein
MPRSAYPGSRLVTNLSSSFRDRAAELGIQQSMEELWILAPDRVRGDVLGALVGGPGMTAFGRRPLVG